MTEKLSTFAQTVYKQKYAHKGEEWPDTAERVVRNVMGAVGESRSQLADDLVQLVTDRKFMPGGRYLYAAGREYHQTQNCFSGDTRFLTDKGVFSLEEMVGETVRIRNQFGMWETAEVHCFGEQEIYDLMMSNGDVIHTTKDHRWWQKNEEGNQYIWSRIASTEVESVPFGVVDTFPELDEEGIRHGIIFGDGCRRKGSNYSHIVFVNQHKADSLLKYFNQEEKEVTVGFGAKRSYNTIRETKSGPIVSLQPGYYKDLPQEYSPEYARGFIAGLIATDGTVSKTGPVSISCEGYEKTTYIAEIAVAAGCVVNSVRVVNTISPFNGSERQLCLISIKPFSAPILLEKHKDIWSKKNHLFRCRSLKVETGFATGRVEPVYCVVAPESEGFTLANGLITSNCALFRAEDSREGWAELMEKITVTLMSGAGIGVVYSDLRERGAPIRRTGGESTGPLALAQMVNEAARHIIQGGSRRSAIWAGLHWNHPDIHEFIRLKDWDPELRALKARDFNFPCTMDMTNISVILDDEFFDAYHDKVHVNHTLAHSVYWTTVKQMLQTSEPGFSIDVGENAGENLRNACVTYNTEILTKEGYRNIGDLCGKETEVWNGEQWSKVTPCVTGKNRPVLQVTLSSGRSLTCTPNHRFILAEGYSGNTKRISASDLSIGDKLGKFSYPVMREGKNRPYAYAQGFLSAKGMDNYNFTFVYGPKFCCIDRLSTFCRRIKESSDKITVYWGFDQHPKSFVPFSWDLQSRLDWIAGLLDGDGTELKEEGAQLCSIDRKFLNNLQKLLTTLGVNSKIVPAHEAGFRVMPDGRGGSKPYYCNEAWKICIGAVQIQELKELGMKCERLSFKKSPQRDASRFETVISVEEAGTEKEVFCFIEPGANRGCFNGIITGQCTEITSRDDSDICNLGSINMARISSIEEMQKVVELGTAFLLAGTVYSIVPFEHVGWVREKNRRLGLGLMGLHEWLLKRGKRYGPDNELGTYLSAYKRCSNESAAEYANAWNLSQPVKKRAIAPCGTIGIVAGPTTTGIEPIFCTAYKRRYLKGSTWHYQYVIEPIAKRLIEEGMDPDDIEDAYTISTEARLEFQAWVQEYVDHGISSTINLPAWGTESNNNLTVEKYGNLFIRYLPRLRGLTCYADGSRGGQPLTPVPYEEAIKHQGAEFVEESADICSISGRGGPCGE